MQFVKTYQKELLEILNCVKVGIYITDGDANTIFVNDESLKTGGHRREELMGKNMQELLENNYVEQSTSLKAISSLKQEAFVQELGAEGKVFVTGVPIIEEKKVAMVVSTEHDLTETLKLKEVIEEKSKISQKYEKELEYLRHQNKSEELICNSKPMIDIMKTALRISNLETTVLVTGESGTGKEVLVNFIVKNSYRKDKPFIKVNCSAIPENLMESEFFGYDEGAFTGAKKTGKLGYFELAHEGTLFLDEIGEMPIQMQSKLLRALQEKKISRVGGQGSIEIDVRIIAATNKDLKEEVEKGNFRSDLYFRLNIIPLEVPPLRDRKEDIEALSLHFIDEFNKRYHQNRTLNKESLKVLCNYNWPGNIRELRNILERIIISTNSDEITVKEVLTHIHIPLVDNIDKNASLKEQVENFEKKLILKLLSQCDTATEVADILNVNKSTISKKIKKYKLN